MPPWADWRHRLPDSSSNRSQKLDPRGQLLRSFQSELNAIVADGPGSFDGGDVATVLFGTIDLIEILTRTECDGFLPDSP
jgi:hypothetical protein